MKKLFILSIMLAFFMKMNAQLFVICDPAYFYPGVLYHQKVASNFGVYGKVWYGDLQKRTDLDHFYMETVKVSYGLTHLFQDGTRLYIGLNRTWFFNYTKESDLVDWNKVHKISFDVGFDVRVTERFTFLMMSDLLNWESCIGVSFKFGKL
jgi:hypothetical protein